MTDHAPLTDEELAEWKHDDPYNSILMRKRFPILIAEVERLRTHACSRTCQGKGEHDIGLK